MTRTRTSHDVDGRRPARRSPPRRDLARDVERIDGCVPASLTCALTVPNVLHATVDWAALLIQDSCITIDGSRSIATIAS